MIGLANVRLVNLLTSTTEQLTAASLSFSMGSIPNVARLRVAALMLRLTSYLQMEGDKSQIPWKALFKKSHFKSKSKLFFQWTYLLEKQIRLDSHRSKNLHD